MSNKLLIIVLATASFLSAGCHSNAPKNVQTAVNSEIAPEPTPEQTPPWQAVAVPLPSGGKVDFKGVSFNYDPKIFGEVKAQEVDETALENETDKPGGEYPKHISFNIKIANREREASLKILPIEDYRRMYVISKHYTKIFDEELTDLQKFLKNKNFRRNGQIPFVPFYDAEQTFQAKVEIFSFQQGRGFFFLTQYDDETSLVNNEGLTYIFQGISDDGKNYILAEFPANVLFLPNGYAEDEFEGYKLSEKQFIETDYKDYILKVTKKLENLPPEEFQPNLKYFQEIISSLKIEK